MRDTELYQNFLGIVSPWSVESMTMDVEKHRNKERCKMAFTFIVSG